MKHVRFISAVNASLSLLLLSSCNIDLKLPVPQSTTSNQVTHPGNTDGGNPPVAGPGTSAPSPPPISSAGWLTTKVGTDGKAHIYLNDQIWAGRGVNLPDIHFNGRNYNLGMADPVGNAKAHIDKAVADWHSNFLRISIDTGSGFSVYDGGVTWANNLKNYADHMIEIVKYVGSTYPGVKVLLTLRYDPTFSNPLISNGVPDDATGIPTAASNSIYVSLVDTFSDANYVMFGVSNEPGGNNANAATISAAMTGAVQAIRGEEDLKGFHHHLISVQGTGYTGDISYYATHLIQQGGKNADGIVYEVHGYMPKNYSFDNLPVIIGEYNTFAQDAAGDLTSFFADTETKSIPHLVWEFEENDGVTVIKSDLTPSPIGVILRNYLRSVQ